jgi:hypothetical protein
LVVRRLKRDESEADAGYEDQPGQGKPSEAHRRFPVFFIEREMMDMTQ